MCEVCGSRAVSRSTLRLDPANFRSSFPDDLALQIRFCGGLNRAAAVMLRRIPLIVRCSRGRVSPDGVVGASAQVWEVRKTSPINSASMPVRRNVSIAWAGVHTMGSLSLNDVLRTSGTPVRAKKREIS